MSGGDVSLALYFPNDDFRALAAAQVFATDAHRPMACGSGTSV